MHIIKVSRMEFQKTLIPGLVVACPRRFVDSRGYFMETYRKDIFTPVIGEVEFVQDNESESRRGVLRGLHLQTGSSAQAKLIRVTEGRVFDVAVDLRSGSATYGHWYGIELSDENALMMYIPRGFAHGFIVLSDKAKFSYKVDNFYDPQSEVTIKFDDPDIGIEWPTADEELLLSERDIAKAIAFRQYSPGI